MHKTLRRVTIGLLSLPAIALLYFAWSSPDRFSRLFMQAGGRIVKRMADHPARVAAFLVATVLLLWLLIAIRCAWEAWRERRKPRVSAPQSVVNG